MMRRTCWAGCSIATALILLTGVEARGQQGWHALDLSTADGQVPELVCIVHEGTPRAQDQLRLDADTMPRLLAAWQAMQTAGDGMPCGSTQPACVARLDAAFASTSHVVCARNAPQTPGNGKVLVVHVHDGGERPRPVEGLVLEGSVARFEIGGEPAPEAPMHARIIGGHYLPGPAVRPIGARFALRPVARCHTSVVELPGRAVAEPETGQLQVQLRQGDRREPLCTRPVSSSFPVHLADGKPGASYQLRVELRAGQQPQATFGADWSTARPPERLSLRPSVVSFFWDAPCEYPEATCPVVHLPDAGVTCSAERMPPAARKASSPRDNRLSCAYRCASSEPRIELPAKVAFEAPEGSASWTARLAASGQTLRTYVPAQERSFPVRFAWDERSEALLDRPGDRIRHVKVTTPRGRILRIEPTDGRRVTLPEGQCGDTFASLVVGDREFDSDMARIEDGWLVIPDPKQSANVLRVGGMVGGGFILPSSRLGLSGPDGLEARAYGTAQLAFRLQPEPHVASALEPRAYELHLSYVIAQQPYFPVHAPDEQVQDEAEYLAFNRWALEAVPLWQLGQRTQLGLGMGVGLGFPVRTQDESAVGKSRLFWIPFTALGRIRISRAVSIEGSFRVMGPEKVYRYEPSPFFSGTPERTEDTLWSGTLGLVGLRLWL